MSHNWMRTASQLAPFGFMDLEEFAEQADRIVICWKIWRLPKRQEKNKNYKVGHQTPRLNRAYEFNSPEEEREVVCEIVR